MRPALSALLACALVLPMTSACANPGSAAEAEAGKLGISWSIEADPAERAKDRVQLELSRRSAKHIWMHSNTRPLADLTGLTAAQLGSDGPAPVSFRFERDAGTIHCSGTARRWRGTGECGFEADPRFVEALVQRGHGRADDLQLFSLALHDLGFDFLDELKRQGYAPASAAELVAAGDHGVGLDYLKGMGGEGYRVGSLAALRKMRDHGVTPDYVSKLARLGHGKLSADDVIRLRDHGVSAEFVGEAARQGFRFETAQLVRLRDHGVTSAYLGELKALGYSNLSADEIVELRSHGVSADFIRRVNASDGSRKSASELVSLRDRGWAER